MGTIVKTPLDVVVIGSGLIGLSTAMSLVTRNPNIHLTVIEKDREISSQQSGHNSGVIHSGIYYKPGSMKSKFCVEGRSSITKFCQENDIPVWTCGKLIVASSPKDLSRLNNLYERGKANKVEGLRLVEKQEIQEIEPHVRCDKGLYAPKTGIVDYREVSKKYADIIINHGVQIKLNTKLIRASENKSNTILETSKGPIESRYVINCAGLHSDLVANFMGVKTGLRIIPFRGEYYTLKKEREYLVKGLIYPTPDPELPFLGVHLTQTMKGWVEAGPNAVLAMKREGYKKTDFSLSDVLNYWLYPGFWKMSTKMWRTGFWEMNRSLRKKLFLKSLRNLVPELEIDDLSGKGSGVRAQAVDSEGNLVDDFRIIERNNSIHVLNAPSPGATSSLVIGQHITTLAEKHFDLK